MMKAFGCIDAMLARLAEGWIHELQGAAIDQDSKLLLELMKEIAVEYGAQARAAISKATGEQP